MDFLLYFLQCNGIRKGSVTASIEEKNEYSDCYIKKSEHIYEYEALLNFNSFHSICEAIKT